MTSKTAKSTGINSIKQPNNKHDNPYATLTLNIAYGSGGQSIKIEANSSNPMSLHGGYSGSAVAPPMRGKETPLTRT
jgi:hypothetical protein